jgi:hypothetical protein
MEKQHIPRPKELKPGIPLHEDAVIGGTIEHCDFVCSQIIDDNNEYYNKAVGLPKSHPKKQEILKWTDEFEVKLLKHIDDREKIIKDLMGKSDNLKSQHVDFSTANAKDKEIQQSRLWTVQEVVAWVKRHVDHHGEAMEVAREALRYVVLTSPKMHKDLREEFGKRPALD